LLQQLPNILVDQRLNEIQQAGQGTEKVKKEDKNQQ